MSYRISHFESPLISNPVVPGVYVYQAKYTASRDNPTGVFITDIDLTSEDAGGDSYLVDGDHIVTAPSVSESNGFYVWGKDSKGEDKLRFISSEKIKVCYTYALLLIHVFIDEDAYPEEDKFNGIVATAPTQVLLGFIEHAKKCMINGNKISKASVVEWFEKTYGV